MKGCNVEQVRLLLILLLLLSQFRSIIFLWQHTGIVQGKPRLGRMNVKGKHNPFVWLHVDNSKKGSVHLSNTFFSHRAMAIGNKAINATYPTGFKDTHQEDEAFRTSSISPRDCAFPPRISSQWGHRASYKTEKNSILTLATEKFTRAPTQPKAWRPLRNPPATLQLVSE